MQYDEDKSFIVIIIFLKPIYYFFQDDCKGEVNFHNINFFYPTRQEIQVLHNLNLTALRGQSIAMVGPSGGGKSSVIQLLERFYDTTTGKVVCHRIIILFVF